MKDLCILITAFVVSLTAAGFTQTTQTISFKVGGTTRNCVVHVPRGINKPSIVFFFHGAGGNGAGFENDTKADVVADREKFIAAYPSGVNGNWNYADGSNDFTFILALIDTIDTRYNIDRNKIYISGFSMGGGMCFALACRYANIFAAAAPVSAAGTACTPSRKIPIFITFGTKDMNPSATYMASVNRWAGIDNCPSIPVLTRPYPSSNPQSVVTRISYGPCAQGTYVVADSVRDGGHGWPTNTKTSVNQADEVWDFCKQVSLNGSTAVYQQIVETRRPVSVSYSSGVIHLKGVGDKSRVQVLDTRGRLVARTTDVHTQFSFKNKPSGMYVVIVNVNQAPVALKMVIP
jgi:poly(3-hydroxybutyrate) depolymerase